MQTKVITREQLDIYIKYSGDIDWLYRLNDKKAQRIFENNNAWQTITILIQDILLIDQNLVSEEYKSRVITEIKTRVDKDAIDLLYKLGREWK